MTDDLVKRLNNAYGFLRDPLLKEAVDRIEELEKAVVDLVQHVSRADLAYSVKTETKLVFRALMDKKDDR